MSTVQTGQKVEVHYIGTFNDGTEFDSSRSRGETISFEVGSGQMIQGFDEAVVGMAVGDVKDITLEPESAYGPHNPAFVQVYSKEVFPSDVELKQDATVAGQNELGQPMIAKIVEIRDNDVVLDFNHPMAGKTLNFNIEIVNIS